MADDSLDKLSKAEQFVAAGDYRSARSLAREIARGEQALNAEEKSRLEAILGGTGIDPAVVAGFALTLGVIVFLLIKYVI